MDCILLYICETQMGDQKEQ